MVGIAALGAAVGGFSKGYMEGEKHRSEMEDAEVRRDLGKSQLKQAKREEQYQDELAKLYTDNPAQPDASATQGGIAAPGVAPVAANPAGAGPAPAAETPVAGAAPSQAPTVGGGIVAPGQQPTGSKVSTGNIGSMQAAIERRQQLDLKYGKINEVQALQMMKNYKQLQQEGVIDGLNYFQQTGDRAGAINMINSTGAMKLDPNASFKIEQKEIAPGFKMPNVVVTSPDGQHSFNQYDALTGALNPKEAFSLKHDVGIKLATLSWQREHGEQLYNLQKQQGQAQIAHWGAMEAEQKRQTQITLDRLGVEQSNRVMAKIDAGRKEANASVGFIPLAEDKLSMLSPAEKTAYGQKMMAGQAVAATWESNIDLKTGNPGITISEAKAATQFANKNPSAVKSENGQWFVNMGEKKVYVPIPPAELEKQFKAGQQGGQPAAPQPGVTAPGGGQPSAPAAAPQQGIRTPQSQAPDFTGARVLSQAAGGYNVQLANGTTTMVSEADAARMGLLGNQQSAGGMKLLTRAGVGRWNVQLPNGTTAMITDQEAKQRGLL